MKDSVEKLQEILLNIRKKKEKVALCHGCFDGLHEGHFRLFEKARELAERVVVGIENDDYIKRTKGNMRPFYKLRNRITAIIKTGLVDYVFVVPSGNYRVYKKIYMDLKPDYLVTAADEVYRKKKKDAIGAGIQVIKVKKEHHPRDKSPNGKGLFGK